MGSACGKRGWCCEEVEKIETICASVPRIAGAQDPRGLCVEWRVLGVRSFLTYLR